MTHHAEVFAEAAAIQDGCTVGLAYKPDCGPVVLGPGAVIRTGTIIYGDVTAGEGLQTGHNVLIREHSRIGRHVLVGTNSVIEGHVEIGDFVKIESNCFIPGQTEIGSFVFLGPGVTLTNDRYPLRRRDEYRSEGPIIEDNVTLGAGVVVCPGVRVGAGSFVAAGAVVIKDIPARSLALGVPAKMRPLPAELDEPNMALSWRKHLQSE